MTALDLANQAIGAGVNTLITKKKLKGEERLHKGELRHEERLHQLSVQQRQELIASQMESSKVRDLAYKDIALYAGIGLVTLVILVTLGIMFVGKKQEQQFAYLMEGA
jgi:hypothetical protein